jgi:serine/threonine protein phosphatase PrpC
MVWEIATAQSLGGRGNQEDGLVVLRSAQDKQLMFAVADGAGGHADGEKASSAAIERLKSSFAAAPSDASAAKHWLAKTLTEANRAVSLLGSGATAPRTTVVVAYIGLNSAIVGHVGDSRLYHFSGSKMAFRTRDHSVVQLLLDIGRLKENEMNTHPDRSRLTKALGGDDKLEPDLAELSLASGDGLAVCSDGVWEHVEAEEINAALQASALDVATRQLVELATARGGSNADNATLILARLR